jgi:hypothetical protein
VVAAVVVAGHGNESSLHSQVKEWYACAGDRFEVEVDGFIVDIVRGDLLIEVQTGNFSSIREKLRSLVGNHRVRLVYPVAERKWIARVDRLGGSVVSRRRSPKTGRLVDVFDELVSIPRLGGDGNFMLEVLLIEEEEVRCDDGRGSWRRRGVSIRDHRLLRVVDSVLFSSRKDYLRFLPGGLVEPFTSRQLSEASGFSLRLARRVTYVLRRMGALRVVGKEGRAWRYAVSVSAQ